MSKDFDWQTEETGWDEEPFEEEPTSRRENFVSWLRRWGRWLAAAAVLLIIVGAVVFTLLNRQVEQVEDMTVANVLTAHGLVRQAAMEKDFDVLGALMSDKDPDWKELQLELLNIDLFLDRQPLALKLVSASPGREATPTVTLSPDLQTAEVVERLPYEITGGEQLSETVWLEHIFFYQRQEDSWLLAPPPESFWGNWQNAEIGDRLTVIHSEREAEIATYMGERLDALAGQICEDAAIECPPGFELEIRLGRDPNDFKTLNENFYNISVISNLGGPYHFSFPSPTLVGRPIDEAGSEALYHGYANWLASIMVFRYIGRTFVLDDEFEEKLASLGLEPPPDPITVFPIPDLIPAPPIPFPEQDVLLACFNITHVNLIRYDPRANRWTDALAGGGTVYFPSVALRQFGGSLSGSLPDDSGILMSLTELDTEDVRSSSKIILWRAGEERLWLESNDLLQIFPQPIQKQFDPSGQNLVIYNSLNTGNNFTIYPYAINLEACLAGDCDYRDFGGFPHWSPDLSRILIVDNETQDQLTLQDEQTGEERFLGEGFSPVWIDDDRFIYIKNRENPETGLPSIVQIIEATVAEPLSGTVLIESADISAAITGGETDIPAGISSVIVHPDRPEWFFIFAHIYPSADPQTAYLLSFRQDTGELTVLEVLDDSLLAAPMQTTPDGQYLIAPTFGAQSAESSFIRSFINFIPLDLETMSAAPPGEIYETSGGFTYDWSQDGRWLLIIGENSFRLIVPGQDYDQKISHDFGFCNNAVWINAPSADE